MEPSRGRNKGLAPSVSSHAKSAEPESCLYSWLQGGLVAHYAPTNPRPRNVAYPIQSKLRGATPTPQPRWELYSAIIHQTTAPCDSNLSRLKRLGFPQEPPGTPFPSNLLAFFPSGSHPLQSCEGRAPISSFAWLIGWGGEGIKLLDRDLPCRARNGMTGWGAPSLSTFSQPWIPIHTSMP